MHACWTNIGNLLELIANWLEIAFHFASFDLLFQYQVFAEFVHFCSSTSEPIKTRMETASSFQSLNSSQFHVQQRNSTSEYTPSPTRDDDWDEKLDGTFQDEVAKQNKTHSSYSMQPLLNVASIENM